MISTISTTKLAASTAESFNKSMAIIDGLRAKNPVMERRFYSYDSEYGIYRTLSKVLNSEKTAQCVKDYIRNLASGEDPVQYLAKDLMAKGLFTPEKLNACIALYDGSLFRLVKISATRHLIDVHRKLKNMPTDNLEDSAGKPTFTLGMKLASDKRLAVDSHRDYEDRDLFEKIITDANLTEFQSFIIERLNDGYKPEEIVKAYSAAKGKSYKMSYYYAQKSLACSSIETAAKKYNNEHHND